MKNNKMVKIMVFIMMMVFGALYGGCPVLAEAVLPVKTTNISMQSAGEKAEFEYGYIEKLNTSDVVTISSSDYSVISFKVQLFIV